MPQSLKPSPLLSPLAALYKLGVSARSALYERNFLTSTGVSIPVICVGNVTTGGSGKTPFVQYLCSALLERGMKPAILLRGYGGKLAGPHKVTNEDSGASVGDEAKLHADFFGNKLSVLVSRNRVDGARLIEKENLASIIVMDDGLQHLALKRDCNILLLDISDEESVKRWSRGQLLPAGWLREDLSAVLKRTSCVIFTSKSAIPLSAPKIEGFTPLHFDFTPQEWIHLQTGAANPLNFFHGKRAAALTAIGTPAHFFASLESQGIQLEQKRALPDHHFFTKSELDFGDMALPILCTEKDAVKLRTLCADRPCYALRLHSGFRDPQESRSFWLQIEDCLERRTQMQSNQ